MTAVGQGRTEAGVTGATSPRQHGDVLTLRWLTAIYIALLSEDFFRKQFGLPSVVLLGKDVLLAGAYLLVLRGSYHVARRSIPAVVILLVTALCFWLLFEATTPLATVLTWLLAMQQYLWYLPLALLAFRVVRAGLGRQLLQLWMLGGVVISLGMFVSWQMGSSAPPGFAPVTLQAGIHTVAGVNVTLPASIFATAEKAADQLLFSLLAGIALVVSSRGRFRYGAICSSAVIVWAMLIASRRTALLIAVAMGLLLLALEVLRWDRSRRRGGRLLAAVLVVATLGATVAGYVTRFDRIMYIAEANGPSDFTNVVGGVRSYDMTMEGQGAGISSPGIQHIGPLKRGAEGTLSAVLFEIGLVGVVLYYGLLLRLLLPLLVRLRTSHAYTRGLSLAAIGMFIVGFKAHSVFANPQVQVMYWLAVGGAWGFLHGRSADATA